MPDRDPPVARARSVHQVELPASCLAAWDWHAHPSAFERLVPPFDPVNLVSSRGTILEGDSKVLALPPFGLRWVARHGRAVRGEVFVDRQERGPFASFEHHHRFAPLTDESCRLSDEIDWRLPLEPASLWLAGAMVRSKLERMFAWRHHVVVHDLLLARALALPALRVELVGAGPACAQVAALVGTQGHHIAPAGEGLPTATGLDARIRIELARIVVEPRRGGEVVFASGAVVIRARDLRREGAWTLVEELAAAVLLAAAGRLSAGAHSLLRRERLDQGSDGALRPLVVDGIELPLRWRSVADLRDRLRGRTREQPRHEPMPA
jgi:ligand-binding SRPBCC domain-containing protein